MYIYTFLYTISVIAIKIYSTLQLELSQVAVVVFAETFFCSNYYFKAKAKKKDYQLLKAREDEML